MGAAAANCNSCSHARVERITRCDEPVLAFERCAPIHAMEACVLQEVLGEDSWIETGRGLAFRVAAFEIDRVLTVSDIGKLGDVSTQECPFGGERRVSLISDFLKDARRHGCTTIIVSWSSGEIVSAALEEADLLPLIDQIFDSSCLERARPVDGNRDASKGILMKEILSKACVPPVRAVFVDKQVQMLDNGKMPCQWHLVESAEGMTAADFNAVRAMLHLPYRT